MSQETEQRPARTSSEGQRTESRARYETALSPTIHYLVPIITVIDLSVIGYAIYNGLIAYFPFVFLGVAMTYILGGLYLFKRLMDYEVEGRRSVENSR